MSRPASPQLPSLPLIGMAVLVLLTVLLAGTARMWGGPGRPADGPALISRELRFADMPDGGVEVTDGRGGRVAILEPGTNAFVRGALRALTRDRRRDELGPHTPFRLTAWQDGRLTLDDPATGHRVDLRAFGQTNAEAFGRLLTSGEDRK
jgi:putative photosynthetic complex assembly protein